MKNDVACRRRAVLVVPGSDERKIRKALSCAADEVILDLEDAVAPARKAEARSIVAAVLREADTSDRRCLSVRINAVDTDWGREDIAALVGGQPNSVIIPKVDGPQIVTEVDERFGSAEVGLQALIETPRGLLAVDEIATSCSRLHSLVLGYADLGAALGRSTTPAAGAWLYAQDLLLLAARAAGIQAIDGPYLGIAADEQFRRDATWTRDLGYDGKWVIHPAQIDTALDIFTPTVNQVDYARRVLDAMAAAEHSGSGAVALDGRMLDEAVAVAARRTLAQVGERQ
jgi:citrate lyase subunit beta/citryl-CoA lyase